MVLGLAGFVGNVIEQTFVRSSWMAWGLSFVFSPGMMIVLAATLEKRRLPIVHNSKAFLPGDLFLGMALALAVELIPTLPATGWWQSPWWIWGVILGMMVFSASMMLVIDGPRYPLAARLSPTKLWHDLGCYFLWGIVLVSVIVPVLVAAPLSTNKILIIILLGLYLMMTVVDVIWPPQLELLHPFGK